MNRHTLTQNPFNLDPNQIGIGYDRMFERMNSLLSTTGESVNQKYPPYNMIKRSDDTIDLELAVAGFAKDELKIILTDGILEITGDKSKDEDDKTLYLHKGIAARNFTKKFTLSDNTEIQGASMEDGLVIIRLKSIIPEHKKPKHIEIKSSGDFGKTTNTKEFLTENEEQL